MTIIHKYTNRPNTYKHKCTYNNTTCLHLTAVNSRSVELEGPVLCRGFGGVVWLWWLDHRVWHQRQMRDRGLCARGRGEDRKIERERKEEEGRRDERREKKQLNSARAPWFKHKTREISTPEILYGRRLLLTVTPTVVQDDDCQIIIYSRISVVIKICS